MSALRGVNLGGWLVIERWMTPSLFEGVDGRDEYSLSVAPGAAAKINKHRAEFIRESDFKWLKANGVEAVRIPVGFWLFEPTAPYVSGQKYLDWAFDMADKYQLQVLISVHGAPGSQNGKDHSGRAGRVDWFRRGNKKATAKLIYNLAHKYYRRQSLYGIELLNEPVPKAWFGGWRLRRWSKRQLHRFGRDFPELSLVYSDVYNPKRWRGLNATLDIHHYQCFSKHDKRLDLAGHLAKLNRTSQLIKSIQATQPVIIGEWSGGLDGGSLGVDMDQARRTFLKAQLKAYQAAEAWFFWSYKTESPDAWNFRYLVEAGVLNLADA